MTSCPHLAILGGVCSSCEASARIPREVEFLGYYSAASAVAAPDSGNVTHPTGNKGNDGIIHFPILGLDLDRADVRRSAEEGPSHAHVEQSWAERPGSGEVGREPEATHPEVTACEGAPSRTSGSPTLPAQTADRPPPDPSALPRTEIGDRGAHGPPEGATAPRPVRVYFVGTRDGLMVKVGKTIDLETRMAALKREALENGEHLELLGVLDGPPGLEALVHKRIVRYRDRTGAAWRKLPHPSEWFRRSGRVAAIVDRVRAGETAAQLFGSAEVARADLVPGPDRLEEMWTKLGRAEAVELLRRLDAHAMVRSLAEFVRGGWSVLEPGVELEWNWHHDAICLHAQAMVEDWIRSRDDRTFRSRLHNLAINVGPVSLKSRIIMVFLPAWVWLRAPSWSVLCASGNASNVERDSIACRDLVTSEWYRETFGVRWGIRPDLDRVAKWQTTAGGMRESRAMGSSFTGIHVDAILLDDPDDAAKVWGDAARRDTWIQWKSMGNRLNDMKRPLRIVVQQNLHEEDLTSRLVREQSWLRLALPVEFDPDRRLELVSTTTLLGWSDPRKSKDEALHAIRFTAEVLADERVRLGSHGFAAQYNCNPRPLDGGMISRAWWRFFRPEQEVRDRDWHPRPRPTGCRLPERDPTAVLARRRDGRLDLDWLTITVDATFGSTSDAASNVGLLLVGGQKQRRFVFDDRTRAMTFLETIAAIRDMVKRYPAGRVLIELKANGPGVVESLELALADGTLVDDVGRPVVLVVEGVGVEGGKESRAQAMVPAIEAGLVYLLEGAAWVDELVGEVSSFPNARRDDRVDALSQLMTRYRGSASTDGARARMQNVL